MYDNRGMTALMYAARKGYIEILELLAPHEKGLRNEAEKTALAMAKLYDEPSIAAILSQYPEGR